MQKAKTVPDDLKTMFKRLHELKRFMKGAMDKHPMEESFQQAYDMLDKAIKFKDEDV